MADDSRARFRKLDMALSSSFSKIKEEMNDFKAKLEMQLGSLKEMKKEIDDSRKDFVGIDKINSLKIKIGDLREELKAVERLEKKLNEIEAKAALKERTEAKLEEIESKVEAIEKMSKDASPDSKVEKLIKEINSEFADLRRAVGSVEEKGGKIVTDIVTERVVKLENEVSKKTSGISSRLSSLLEDIRQFPTKQEINQVLRGINKEFDDVKGGLDNINILKNDLKTIRREKLGKRFFEQKIEEMAREMENMGAEISELKRKGFRGKTDGEKKRRFNFYFFANFMIVLAFLLLGASLFLFFIEKDAYMDYLIYASIISFVIGVLTRVVLVVRG